MGALVDEHPEWGDDGRAISPAEAPPWTWSILPAKSWDAAAEPMVTGDERDMPAILAGRGIAVVAQELSLGRRLLMRQAEEIAALREERGRLVAELEHARAAVQRLAEPAPGALSVPREWVLMVLGLLVVLTALAGLLLIR